MPPEQRRDADETGKDEQHPPLHGSRELELQLHATAAVSADTVSVTRL